MSPDSPLLFFSSFDETTTPDAEELTETVLHLNLGFFFCLLLFFFPFDEKMTELLHRH
jgi:hypothetical protein